MTRQIGFPKHQAVEAFFAPFCFGIHTKKANGFGLEETRFQNTNAGPDKTSHCPGVCDHRSGGAAPVRSKCHGTIWETFRRLEYGNTSKYIIHIEFHFIIIVI